MDGPVRVVNVDPLLRHHANSACVSFFHPRISKIQFIKSFLSEKLIISFKSLVFTAIIQIKVAEPGEWTTAIVDVDL